jgi:DNA gyrase subunit A
VIGIARVEDDDELLMMTARGKIQRIAAREISVIGRNTSGVRIMGLDEGDTLAAIVRVPKEESDDEDVESTAEQQLADTPAPETAAGDTPASPEQHEEGHHGEHDDDAANDHQG